MSVVRNRHDCLPAMLTRPTACGEGCGFPRYWLTVFADVKGADLADSTMTKVLSAINKLYAYSDGLHGPGSLDRFIADTSVDDLTALLQGYFSALSHEAQLAGINRTRAWQEVMGFVTGLVDELAHFKPGDLGTTLRQRLAVQGLAYANLKPAKETGAKRIRALPAVVIEDLYIIMDPASARNPFRTEEARWRWWAIFLLLLHEGLRRGEALLAREQSFHDEIDLDTGEAVFWMNVTGLKDGEEKLWDRSGIKTVLSHRQIPLSRDLVAVLDRYTLDFRGQQGHPLLFKSWRNRPLGRSTVNAAFNVVSNALSPAALAALRNWNGTEKITPHALRHTSAVVRLSAFLEDGQTMDLALQNMRAFFGWTEESLMPLHYSRAYFENGLSSVWNRRMDARADTLRHLSHLERTPGIDPTMRIAG